MSFSESWIVSRSDVGQDMSLRRHNLVIGLSKTPVRVFTRTRRARPFVSGKMRPIGQELRGEVSSYDQNYVSGYEIILDLVPFLSLLHQREILPCPSFPEEV